MTTPNLDVRFTPNSERWFGPPTAPPNNPARISPVDTVTVLGGKADNTSKILLINIHSACSRLNVFWRGFERRWNADHLRNRQGLRFKLIAYQDQHAKKNGPSDEEVRQNWHPHDRLRSALSEQRPTRFRTV